jgi:hypothetical protein
MSIAAKGEHTNRSQPRVPVFLPCSGSYSLVVMARRIVRGDIADAGSLCGDTIITCMLISVGILYAPHDKMINLGATELGKILKIELEDESKHSPSLVQAICLLQRVPALQTEPGAQPLSVR